MTLGKPEPQICTDNQMISLPIQCFGKRKRKIRALNMSEGLVILVG